EDDLSVTNIVRESLLAGDVAVHVRWDAVEEVAWFEFWESEYVEFRYAERNRHRLESVVVTELEWVLLPDGDMGEKWKTTTYGLVGGECVRRIRYEGDDDSERVEYLGIPFVPWGLL